MSVTRTDGVFGTRKVAKLRPHRTHWFGMEPPMCHALAFSPRRSLLVTASEYDYWVHSGEYDYYHPQLHDSAVVIWDLHDPGSPRGLVTLGERGGDTPTGWRGRPARATPTTLAGHADTARVVSISPDDMRLATELLGVLASGVGGREAGGVTAGDGGRVLVLGGGGVTGIGWEVGLIAGLAEAGVDLRDADLVIGTSAGAAVAAQLGSDQAIEQLYAAQLQDPVGERAAKISMMVVLRLVGASLSSRRQEVALARLGRMAVRARTVEVAQRRAIIESRLPARIWPDRPRLRLTAVDADSGRLQVFDAGSGVELVDAVAASCAVPFVWPPVPIGGRRFIDGGVRSPTNADLATGAERIVVLAPLAMAMRRAARPGAQLAGLGPGARHVLVTPAPRARRDMGRNPLDPALRSAAARAGRAQAADVLDAVQQVWAT